MAGSLPEGFQVDPELSKQYGATVAVNPATGQKMKWNDGGVTPPGALPRPEYGGGAYETPDGAVFRTGKTGAIQTLRGAQTAGADSRTRLDLGLGPAIEAQKNMYAEERWKTRDAQGRAPDASNPYDTFGGVVSNLLADGQTEHPIRNMVGKAVGGDRVARYKQAASSFEAAFLPILSGSAVTPSEAARQIKANLPEPGDSPQILSRKSTNRAMMINAAAKLSGKSMPFARLGAFDFGSQGGEAPAAGGSVTTIDLNGRPIK